jgi:hypothetical protein
VSWIIGRIDSVRSFDDWSTECINLELVGREFIEFHFEEGSIDLRNKVSFAVREDDSGTLEWIVSLAIINEQ